MFIPEFEMYSYEVPENSALESCINFANILGDISLESSLINIDWSSIKKTIKQWLQNIWRTVRNFISQFFINKEVMLNEKAIDNLSKYVKSWESTVEESVRKYLQNDDISVQFLIDIVKNIQDECQKNVVDRNQAILGGNSQSFNYKIYKQTDILVLSQFTSRMERLIDNAIANGDKANSAADLNGVARANNLINKISIILQTIDTAIAKVMVEARFENKNKAGHEEFDNPITVTVMS